MLLSFADFWKLKFKLKCDCEKSRTFAFFLNAGIKVENSSWRISTSSGPIITFILLYKRAEEQQTNKNRCHANNSSSKKNEKSFGKSKSLFMMAESPEKPLAVMYSRSNSEILSPLPFPPQPRLVIMLFTILNVWYFLLPENVFK